MTTEERKHLPGALDPSDVVVLDGKGLRALAHPVRIRIIGLLRRHGPSTATRLAEQLGLASGATSYHLRQLAAAGLVVEDADRGNRRDRWWRAAHRLTAFDDPEVWESDPEAAMVYMQSIVGVLSERMQRWVADRQTAPEAWKRSGGLSDRALRLTPEETERLDRELDEVVSRYRAHPAGDDAPAGAETVFVQWAVMPEVDAAPDTETDTP